MDALGAGNGHHELGKATIRRMVSEGHELGNQTWSTCPAYSLTPKQLTRELQDTHRLLSSARQVALAADSCAALDDDTTWQQQQQQQQQQQVRSRRWFRPAGGWVTPGMVEAAERLGYTTVLGSVFPWDTVKVPLQPLVHALYIWSKVYSGAVIVLHDRRDELLPTLRYVLPWLKAWGYDIVSLGEAAAAAAAGQSELTFDTLAAHTLGVQGYFAHTKQHSQHQAGGSGSAQQYGNSSYADLQGLDAELDASLRSASERASPGGGGLVGWKASAGSLRQLEGVTDNADKLRMSAAYMAQMAKERERAAIIAAAEEAERARMKAAKRAEADRKAGIDRRLVDMSAAEKRAIERREREKKEAEKRRARRKVEEARAKERYEEYVKQKAQEEVARREAEAAAALKAAQDAQRRQLAEEAFRKRQEAERAAAAELRLARDQEEAAARAAAAVAAISGGEISPADTEAPLARDSASVTSSVSGDKRKKRLPGLFRKLSNKLSSKKASSSSAAEGSAAAAGVAAAAAAALAGEAAAAAAAGDADAAESSQRASAAGVPAAAPATPDTSVRGGAFGAAAAANSGHSSSVHMPGSFTGLAGVAYGWYGQPAALSSLSTLASIDAALTQQRTAISELAEAAAAASGIQLSTQQQLAGSWAEHTAAAIAAYEGSLPAPAVGRYARSPTGRVLLGLDAQPLLLCDGPEGQSVVLNSRGEALLGPNGEQLALLLGATGSPLVDPIGRPVLVALQAGSSSSSKPLGVHPDGSIVMVPASQHAAAAAAVAALTNSAAAGLAAAAADAAAGSSGGHAVQGSAAAAAGNSLREAGSYAPSLARSSTTSHSHKSPAAGTPGSGGSPTAITSSQSPPPPAAAAAAGAVGMVPAELLLGPHGKPLLGVDNRPLIVAVDDQGVPLVCSSEGAVLLGPDDRPLVLATASDGSLVALDSQCRPLTGPDGRPRVVALSPTGRPLVDGDPCRPVLLSLGPNGLPFADSRPHRVSWAGSASGARLSHSGTQSNLLLAAQPGSGLEVMVSTGEDDALGVMDAADYGQYSAASLGIMGGTTERQLSFSHERALQQRLMAVGEDLEHQQQQQQELGMRGSTALAPAVNEAWLPSSMVADTNCSRDQTERQLLAGPAAAAAAAAAAAEALPHQQPQLPQTVQQQEQLLLVSGVLQAQEKPAPLLCEQQLVQLTASGHFELAAAAAAAAASSASGGQ
uniref:NodB homology domain-containing protein n=1 Tax=Tetradesmus obliquus TaxID=3088 RepID=A0A383WHY1_TETOB|eukprot:jgi/Sobl393_1/2777/SZX76759.1